MHKYINIIRIRASSLVEVSIAMVITGIVFSAALMIMLNIASGSDNLQKVKYDLLLRQMVQETVQHKTYLSGTIVDGTITIEKEIITYLENPELFMLRFTAWRGEKELAKYKTLVYEPED
jgi:hypothetical protein